MSVSIKDVAKISGVSVATVSRVLNKSGYVSEETKKRVLEAIEKTGYKPNAIARSLKVKNTRTIGIMIPDISSHFFPEVVRGIEDIANLYNYNIILCNTDLDRDKEERYLDVLAEKQTDGIIFMSNTITDTLAEKIKKTGIDVVLISTDYKDMPSVTINNMKASEDAVKYIIKKGYKKIAFIGGPMDDPNAGLPRFNGFVKALTEGGLSLNRQYICEGDYRFTSGYKGAKKLLNLPDRPDAIFAASDEMALGVIRAALEMKIRVPEDLGVVGFDDINISEMAFPSLTTIAQPLYDMGAIGMRLLTKILNKEKIDSYKMILEHRLIVRESC